MREQYDRFPAGSSSGTARGSPVERKTLNAASLAAAVPGERPALVATGARMVERATELDAGRVPVTTGI